MTLLTAGTSLYEEESKGWQGFDLGILPECQDVHIQFIKILVQSLDHLPGYSVSVHALFSGDVQAGVAAGLFQKIQHMLLYGIISYFPLNYGFRFFIGKILTATWEELLKVRMKDVR